MFKHVSCARHLACQGGNAELAVPQFDAMVKLLNAKQEDGLLAMVAALNGEKDAAALQVIREVAKNYPATSAASYALGLAHVSHREYQAAENLSAASYRARSLMRMMRGCC